MNTTAMRSRWAAVGAAVAVTLGAGGIGFVSATSPEGAVAYVPLDASCRAADTRPGDDNVGDKSSPLGPAETHIVNSNDGDCDGLIPSEATSVQLNVTALNSTIPSFLTIWADGERPNASSLNPTPGQPPVPNAVTTAITDTGDFNIFNNAGNVDVVVDIAGYYTDHHHDDRYYTKDEADDGFVNVGPVTLRQGLSSMQPYYQDLTTILYRGGGTRFTANGSGVINLDGPAETDGRQYRLVSLTYCIEIDASRFVNQVRVWSESGTTSITDETDRSTDGCYSVEMGDETFDAYGAVFVVEGVAGNLDFDSLTTTWEPVAPTSLTTSTADSTTTLTNEDG